MRCSTSFDHGIGAAPCGSSMWRSSVLYTMPVMIM